MKRYILWLNYGTEGWLPKDFDTLPEVFQAIQSGETYGQPFEITGRIDIGVAA